MKIGGFDINNSSRVFIIAELSANHGKDLEVAKETVRAAKRAGADAIKLQTYTPDSMTLDVQSEYFMIKGGTIWDGSYFYDLYEEASLPWEWHKEIFEVAKEEGLECFSTPFDFKAVDLLEKLDTPAYKIASLEIVDIPLIKYVASKGKPIIMSTGIANEEDIELALAACREMGNNDIALLKCTSAYPAKIEEANLITIKDYVEKYNIISGLSDHTMGALVPTVSVAMGAKIIEKHFILDKSIGGPDASFSMDEKEFREMVYKVRQAELAIGKVSYELTDDMVNSRRFSRSLFIAENMKKGDVINEENLRAVRPGDGIHPKNHEKILGKIVNCDLEKGTPMKLEYLA